MSSFSFSTSVGRHARKVQGILSATALLIGCISCSGGDSTDSSSAPGVADTHSTEVGCDAGRPADEIVPSDGDLNVGQFRYLGLKLFSKPGSILPSPSADGIYFYKAGAMLPARGVATVSVLSPSTATIRTERSAGFHAVTYQACIDGPTVWVGGIDLKGAPTACVTLRVTGMIGQEAAVTVPLGAMSC